MVADKDTEIEELVELAKKHGVQREKNSQKKKEIWQIIAEEYCKRTGIKSTGKQLSKRFSYKKQFLKSKRTRMKESQAATGGGPKSKDEMTIQEMQLLCDMNEPDMSYETQWDSDALLVRPGPSTGASKNAGEATEATKKIGKQGEKRPKPHEDVGDDGDEIPDLSSSDSDGEIVNENATTVTVHKAKKKKSKSNDKVDCAATASDEIAPTPTLSGTTSPCSPRTQTQTALHGIENSVHNEGEAEEGNPELIEEESPNSSSEMRPKVVRLRKRIRTAEIMREESVNEYFLRKTKYEEAHSQAEHEVRLKILNTELEEASLKRDLQRQQFEINVRKHEREEMLFQLRLEQEKKMFATRMASHMPSSRSEFTERSDSLTRCGSSGAIRRLDSAILSDINVYNGMITDEVFASSRSQD